jgi:hypothetical protein
MRTKNYLVAIKTRDAELRCFKNLDISLKGNLLPLYELTKSRKTTKTPDGDINRRMKQIAEIQSNEPFILDLCTDEKYVNPQIENLLNPRNGFLDWQYFLFENYRALNIIPMVHIFEDDEGVVPEVTEFVKKACEHKDLIAVRLPFDLDESDYQKHVSSITNSLLNGTKLIIILDAGYIRDLALNDIESLSGSFIEACGSLSRFSASIQDIYMLSTSFPSSPATAGKEDAEGQFQYFDEDLFKRIRQEYPIKYGDYGSINTQQIEMKGGTFVPRIDIPIFEDNQYQFIYKRFRRDDGSYIRCAIQMLSDNRYQSLQSWPDDEIELAAAGNPTGISPSYWISIRMNYYIHSKLSLHEQD